MSDQADVAQAHLLFIFHLWKFHLPYVAMRALIFFHYVSEEKTQATKPMQKFSH